MQLARISHASLEARAAAYLEGKVVDLQAAHARAEGRPDPLYAGLAGLLAAGADALAWAEELARGALAAGEGRDLEEADLLAPTAPRVFLGLGYNYKELAVHQGAPFNAHPEPFALLPGCAVGHGHPIRVPRVIEKIDFEAELGVVIGRTARRVRAGEALAYVGGYTAVNDFTAKIIPRPPESGSVTVPLKAVDTFGPMGPTLIPAAEVPDPQGLTLLCRVNGEEKQRFPTGDMVHTVAEVIEFITARITLNPGDVIATGTSVGIGIIKKPPEFLAEGDVVETQIEGYPVLRNRIEWEKD